MERRVPIIQIAPKSEWALARFFDALRDPDINSKFFLEAICGREKNSAELIAALYNRRKEIEKAVRLKEWRAEQRQKESDNAKDLISLLENNKLKYFQVRKDTTLPQEIYDHQLGKALVIHSLNITHGNYIRNGLLNRAHILCEKPLTVVADIDGYPYDKAMTDLEKTVSSLGEGLVIMDAEHYSYKKPSLIFYEKLDEYLTDKKGNLRKIKKVEGEIKELDKPDWKRTREILSFSRNQTGLLGDTMCHLLAFISNLGGRAVPEEREYDCYPGFDADTYDSVGYKIVNEDTIRRHFAPNATANFSVSKFIDKMKGAKKDAAESKFVRFTLDDNSEIVLDFKDGTITRDGERCTHFRYSIAKNEYVNVLNEFYEAIMDNRKPLTDYRHSMYTLQSNFETYALPEEKNRRISVYRTRK